jgi:hypothetical protein
LVIVARCTVAPPDEPSWPVRTHRQATPGVEESAPCCRSRFVKRFAAATPA